ncbi:uncharacterized protein PB18E9.04c-like [Schistocerca piceifrons]|uniref:uncharacterized protein PB18E9.04c-like n=1 Tax=Schistocerca piceifrons TaxID=274613 RepID=UPI001F5FA2A9|nr:uncharacterized protein PB18E9.04c-like [Schistocerca piceifrons]
MDAPSIDVPATAFLSERRDSLPSSDTEGRTRKQRSPKRRKRRRHTVSERDGSPPPDAAEAVRPDEASENLHDDTNDDNMTPTVAVSMPTLLARTGAPEPMDSTAATAAETSPAPTTDVEHTTITTTAPSMRSKAASPPPAPPPHPPPPPPGGHFVSLSGRTPYASLQTPPPEDSGTAGADSTRTHGTDAPAAPAQAGAPDVAARSKGCGASVLRS